MADYVGFCRSNYFRLKDAEAAGRFREICERYGLQPLEGGVNSPAEPGLFGFHCKDDGPAEGAYPAGYYDGGELVEESLCDELAPLLADGSVCVLMEVGREHRRYLNGWATAFTNRCDPARDVPDAMLIINLDDIIDRARERWGGEVTEVGY
jgi:hypothetical protein